MNEYLTTKEAAEQWDVSERQVQVWCKADMINGVTQFGKSWAIPISAVKPTRTKNYKPGRKSKDKIVENSAIL
ncbi:MAG: helix-turn-helix domain-containing protein [Oscillospiraceae bacterium]|jgi:predicted site-specific integrase-resolvase|nr:helix-turn-helix domain-containing protein [Oscillospiraceae bacterium]